MARKTESRIVSQLQKVKDRIVADRARRDAVVHRHLAHLVQHLAPHRQLQERCINFNYFLNEGGPDFVRRLVATIDTGCVEHKVLYL